MTAQRPVYAPPFSLRLTLEERAFLETLAGRMPLGVYIRARLLDAPAPRKRLRKPVKDDQALGQMLAALGRSHIGNNLNQLARACHSGSLPVTPETEQALLAACVDVQEMRQELVKALGLSGTEP